MSASSEPTGDKRSGNVRKAGRRKRLKKQLKSITSQDQVFLTQSNASENCAPLNLTLKKIEIEADEETSVFEDSVRPEIVVDEAASNSATTDLNNNSISNTSIECYSLKHKKFRKRSYMGSTGSISDPLCENDQSVENDAPGEKLKNLPIKKRRKYLDNGDDTSHSGESHSRNEDELLSNHGNNADCEQERPRPKSHESVKQTQFTAIFNDFSQFSMNYSNNKNDGEFSKRGVNSTKTQNCRQVKRRPSFSKSKVHETPDTEKDGNANLKCGWFSDRRIANSSNSSPGVNYSTNSPLIKSAASESSKHSVMENVSKTRSDKMTPTTIKSKAHLDIGSNEAKSQGQKMDNNAKNMSREDKECASRNDGINFYQKRKTTDTTTTCSECLHCTAHAYEVTGAVTRKITKPCDSFVRNQHEREFDWRLNSNNARGFNYLSHSHNSDSDFSEYQSFSPPIRGGSFRHVSKNYHVEEAGPPPPPGGLTRDNCPSRTRSKLKYERNSDKYQAICAAGPDMAEGNNDLKLFFILSSKF